jgi:tRNA A-37 threonylcarbamoyl transferase component Bud32
MRPPLSLGFELDSPAVRGSKAEPKVPSCPQKQKTPAAAPGEESEDSIQPRFLGKCLEETDPVAELTYSLDVDMKMQSPAGAPAPPPHFCGGGCTGAGSSSATDSAMMAQREGGERRGASEAFGPEAHRKRFKHSGGGMRLGFDDDHTVAGSSSAAGPSSAADDAASMPPPPQRLPPPIRKENSMKDTKMLYVRPDRRSCSFSAPAGSRDGFKFEDHFSWIRKLGAGSFSDVYEVQLKSRPNERYAVKCSKREFKSKGERAEFLHEVELANQLPQHPNVVEYYRAWQESQVFCVQMELCAGGTLRRIMNQDGLAMRERSSEFRVWEIVLHICRGLAHIHAHDVIHCDLKPENILVSQDGAFKIGDLGLATSLNAWDEQEGDARYLSRDLLDSIPSTAADIFSFGIMLYEIATGETLPGHGDHWDHLRSGHVPPLCTCSAHLAQLISTSMSSQPRKRPTAPQILMVTADAMATTAQETAMAAHGGLQTPH